MKRRTLPALILLALVLAMLVPHIAFAGDVFFKVIEDTPFWAIDSSTNPNNIIGNVMEGSIVRGGLGPYFSGSKGAYEGVFFQTVYYNGRGITVFTNSLLPAETQDLFDVSLLYNPERPLVSSYYIDAMRSLDREVIYLHNKAVWDDWLLRWERDVGYATDWWAHSAGSDNLTITQTLLKFDTNEKLFSVLLIKNIAKTGKGYTVTVGEHFMDLPSRKWWPWPYPDEQSFFDVLIIPDGDYIDVYLHDTGNLVDTFAYVDREFTDQLSNLIRQYGYWNNPVDLSNIVWPRRADGSTDYPPPDGTTVPDFQASQKTHGELALPIRPRDRQSRSQTTDRLRVRENPDTASSIVTTLDAGTHVQLLETGTTETIGGITAPWVKVLAENGFTGWAFSGYLEELAPEQENPETQNLDLVNPELENVETQNPDSANSESENLEQENMETPNLENKKSSFPVLPFVIAGSPILVSGIAVVLAKRRKGKAAKP